MYNKKRAGALGLVIREIDNYRMHLTTWKGKYRTTNNTKYRMDLVGVQEVRWEGSSTL